MCTYYFYASCHFVSSWDETVWVPDPESFRAVSEQWYLQLQTLPAAAIEALSRQISVYDQLPSVTWLCICDECVESAEQFVDSLNGLSETSGASIASFGISYNMVLTSGDNPALQVVAVLDQGGDPTFDEANGAMTGADGGLISPPKPDLADSFMFPPLPSVGNSGSVATASPREKAKKQPSLPESDAKKEGNNQLATYAKALHKDDKKKGNSKIVEIEQGKQGNINGASFKKASFADVATNSKGKKNNNVIKNEEASAEGTNEAVPKKTTSEAATQTKGNEDYSVIKNEGASAVNTNETAPKKITFADIAAMSKGKGNGNVVKNEGPVAVKNGAASKKTSFADAAAKTKGKGNGNAVKNEGPVAVNNGAASKKASFAAAAAKTKGTGNNGGATATTSPKKVSFADIAAKDKRTSNGKN